MELKEFADRAGIRFAVFGMDWDQHPILKEVDGGALNHDEMLSVYGRSKLVFNPGWSFDSGVHNYQIKLRHFEVAGCRACQITNHNPELAELFRPNEEVLFYRDLESLKDTILHYLQADETREAIAEAGYLRALREHTMGHRLDDLFEECARLFPPSASPLQTTPQVIRVIVGACAPGNPHARDCLQIERMDDLFRPDIAEQLPNGGYVHLISGTILPLIRTTDYGSVLPMLARCKAPITHCDSLLRLPPLGKNPVQVDRGNFNGSTLNQARSLGLPPSIGAYFEEMVISGRNYFQINLLFAAHLFKSAAPDPLDSLDRNDIYESQRLICDLDIPQRGPAFKTCLNQRLADAFCAIEQLELKYVVWGAAGEMSIILPCWIDDHPSGFLGYLDRSLAGQSKGGHIIHSPERLDELQPDLVFIAATISGPTIFESMRDQRARYLLLPLYDLNHRNWFCGFS
ncbi:glycosyltransferase family protein [Magnetovirga frankeli]|uniref:glycosyltransferase family protein n=1 Tax=Magnetovirga frankeli TaxID=947516 RepID=UPI003D3470EE